MTTPKYLTTLDDEAARATLVEHLRCAHGILTGAALDYGPEINVRVAHVTAAALLDVAQRLCAHVRVSGDGRCRYCSTLIDGVRGD